MSTTCLLSEFLTYATTVERAFNFLVNDTGEDRWLCTLMVRVVDGEGEGMGGAPVHTHVAYTQEGGGVPVALYFHGVCSRGGCVSTHVIM